MEIIRTVIASLSYPGNANGVIREALAAIGGK